MARAAGVAILGPPPTDLIAPIERSRLLRTLADDLAWSIEVQAGTYGVLNACRALRFEREGVLSTKIEGGEWAIEHGVADVDLLASALRYQRGADAYVDGSRAASLATWVRLELLTAANA
jgi:streptomycin 3"-adenylyltransferase